jgi:large subunit ribosomal protein L1
MGQHGKRYKDAAKLIERGKNYEPDEAMTLLKDTAGLKFDPTVEAHIRLGVDPRHAEQMVRGTIALPHGSGKVVRVAVFAQGDKAAEATAAGADFVGGDDLAERVEGGWLDFDIAVATPDMMGRVGKLGRILGRRGLMPNPKSGTVTFDIKRVVGELKGGRIEFKVDKAGIIHVAFGRGSFEVEQLADNLAALTDAINRAKPKDIKGVYFKSLTVASTMGPGIRLDVPALLARAAA